MLNSSSFDEAFPETNFCCYDWVNLDVLFFYYCSLTNCTIMLNSTNFNFFKPIFVAHFYHSINTACQRIRNILSYLYKSDLTLCDYNFMATLKYDILHYILCYLWQERPSESLKIGISKPSDSLKNFYFCFLIRW